MSQPVDPQPTWAIPNAEPEAGAGPPQGQAYAVPAPPQAPGYPPPTYPAYGYPASPAPGGGQPLGVAVAPSSTSAVVLLVVSGVAIVASGIIGIPSAVLAILALRSGSRDPAASRRTTRVGWIVLAVNAAIGLVLIALLLWWLRRR
ncbi:MAG: hypothetical protein WCG47_14350 [Dermatophilaceae bacterium]